MPEPAVKKTKDDGLKFQRMVADKQGWVLNPDHTLVEMLAEGLVINYNRYGYFACPCRDADGIKEKDKDIICPCAYCRPDQAQYGHCYCGLYLTQEFAKTGAVPHSIPERRK